MEDLLFNVDVTPHMIYLSLILLVLGRALKELSFIGNWAILWILLVISIVINFVFVDFPFASLFEAIISTSLAVTLHQTYKQTNEGVKMIRKT
ncbi:MAG: phage holin family protein [Bacilli bacterium]|nr:phage holin family protein [Bacilli bacterium]